MSLLYADLGMKVPGVARGSFHGLDPDFSFPDFPSPLLSELGQKFFLDLLLSWLFDILERSRTVVWGPGVVVSSQVH
jgi:hypothetical protein